ncbi:MAG: RHS repeat-associated core domain-containing protein, partial [Clostridia bacterium]|nr:RHS repeat-associated core domain-containing protein [Clostridia bacterium]
HRYHYVLNLQGDVIAILDSGENIVCKYTYDAWGKILSMKDGNGNAIVAAGHIGNLNPLRYRGYYYDNETGLYYLRSRYYDPVVGRFIGPDSYISTGQGLVGYNRFAYCLNNPVILTDESGEFAGTASVASILLCAAVAGLTAALISEITILVVDEVADVARDIPAWWESLTNEADKEETTTEAVVGVVEPENPKKPVFFPLNPHDFKPKGLIKVVRPGTKNGTIISWMFPSGKVEVFRWDQNTNYSNGPHYHIYNDDNHYYAGDLVPEPLATIHFG